MISAKFIPYTPLPKGPIYTPRNRAHEYCDLAVNIYDSCPHGCTYCYARSMAKRFGKPWGQTVNPRHNIVEAVQRQLYGLEGHGRKIHLCFTCDPYPIGYDSTATREIIKAIKKSGNHVQILTKGDETARRDFDLMDENDSFGVTLTGGWKEEPGASNQFVRIDNIIKAKELGIETWISCEPVLDPLFIINTIAWLSSADLWRIGKLNHRSSTIDWHQFGHQVETMCKTATRNYVIKEDLRKEMAV